MAVQKKYSLKANSAAFYLLLYIGLLLLFFTLFTSTRANAQEYLPDYEGKVVHTGRKISEPLKETASTIQVVTGEQIRTRTDQSAAEALRLLPGVYVQDLGTRGESVQIRLRGARGADTLVLLDGVRLNNPATNETNLSLIPVDLIDRIEVLQGSQAVLYGGGAVGGVVHIITKKGTADNQFVLTVEGGNLGRIRELLSWQGSKGPVQYSLAVSRDDEQGQFDNDGFGQTALTQRWDIIPDKKTQLTLASHILISQKNLARGFLIAPAPLYDPALPMDAAFLQLALENNRGNDSLLTTQSLHFSHQWNGYFKTEFDYGFYLSDEQENDSSVGEAPFPTPSGIPLAPNSLQNNLKAMRNSAEIRQFFFLPKLKKIDQTILAGFEFYDERVRTSGSTFPGDPPPPMGTLGPFLPPLATIPQPGFPGDRQNYSPFFLYHLGWADRIYFDAGFRWDINSAYGNELSPRAELAVLIPEVGGKFHGAYGEGFLPPTIIQLFNPISGNPNLQPQKSQSYEAGYEQQIKGKAFVYATYFYLDFDNLISRLGTNTDDAFSTGVEAGFQWQLIPSLTLSGNYTYTHSRDESNTGLRIPNIPNHVFNGIVRATPWRSLEIESNVTVVSDQREEFPIIAADGRFVGGTPVASLMGGTNPGWVRWDLGVSYQFELFNPHQEHPRAIRVYGRANNILNADIEENFGFPSPGFNFLTGADVYF